MQCIDKIKKRFPINTGNPWDILVGDIDTCIKYIIPSGEVIQRLRKTDTFNYADNKVSLCRDGFHMDYCYGRYAVGLIWYKQLYNANVLKNSFVPELSKDDKNADEKICIIKEIVNKF